MTNNTTILYHHQPSLGRMRDRSRAAKDRVRNLMEGITLTMTEEEKRMAVMIRGRGQGTLGNRAEGIRAIHLTNGASETDYFRY